MNSKRLVWILGIAVIVGGIVLCGGCFLLGGLAAITGGDTSTAGQGDGPARGRDQAVPVSYGVNQDVQVGEVRWKILEAQDLGPTLTGGQGSEKEKTTAGRWVRVHFEFENLSSDMQSFSGIKVVDDQGREFTASSDVFSFFPEPEWCVLENINPNVPKTCTHIYEVPANATSLKLVVTDLEMFGSEEAQIDLGF